MRTTKLPSASRLALLAVMHRETIGQRIAERREALGLSQEQLAERIGVRAQTVSRWERGANLGRIGNLDRVAEALEITMSDLMADLEPTNGNGQQEKSTDATDRIEALEGEVSELRGGLVAAVELLLDQAEREAEAAERRAEGQGPSPRRHEPERVRRLAAARQWAERQRRTPDGG